MFWKGLLDNKILLITGYNENSEQAEVLDLVAKESTVLPSTFSFPEKIYAATGGVIHGIPFIIGGINRDSLIASNECWKLTSEGWQPFAQLKTARCGTASVVLQDNQIWVTGGRDDGDQYLKSTAILTMETNQWKEGPDLPTKLCGHAMAKIDEKKVLIIGGHYGGAYKKNCWIYDHSSSQFTPGPDMNDARRWFGWGILSSSLHNNRQCLLVAGGYYDDLKSCEILDFTRPNATWKRIEDLPKVTCDRVSIVSTPDKKGVLAIMNGHDIYELKIENGKFVWKEYPIKTKISRLCSVAIQM